MRETLLVGFGGAIGSLLRYAVGLLFAPTHIGLGAELLWINGLGSLIVAFVTVLSLEFGWLSSSARLFLTSGMMGGFTTFSGFAVLLAILAKAGATNLLLVSALGHLVLLLLAPLAGMVLARLAHRIAKGGIPK